MKEKGGSKNNELSEWSTFSKESDFINSKNEKEDFATIGRLASLLGVDPATVKSKINITPDSDIEQRQVGARTLYNVDAVLKIFKSYLVPKVDKVTGIYINDSGVSFASANKISSLYSVRIPSLLTLGDVQMIRGKDSLGHLIDLYSIEDVLKIKNNFLGLPVMVENSKEMIHEDRVWVDRSFLGKKGLRGDRLVDFDKAVQEGLIKTLDVRTDDNIMIVVYDKEDVTMFLSKSVARIDANTGVYINEDKKYSGVAQIAKISNLSYKTVVSTLKRKKIPKIDGVGISGRETDLYELDEAIKALSEYQVPAVDAVTNLYKADDGVRYMTAHAMHDKFGFLPSDLSAEKVRRITGRGVGGHLTHLYCVEDLLNNKLPEQDEKRATAYAILDELSKSDSKQEDLQKNKRNEVRRVPKISEGVYDKIPKELCTQEQLIQGVKRIYTDLSDEIIFFAFRLLTKKYKGLIKRIRVLTEGDVRVIDCYELSFSGLLKSKTSEYVGYEFPPENWKSAGQVAGTYKVDFKTVERVVTQYKSPDKVKSCIAQSGKIQDYYHPDLVIKIIEHVTNAKSQRETIPFAPIGWKTLGALSLVLKVSFSRLEKIAGEYRKNNPDWFSPYRVPHGASEEHISPALIEIIRNDIFSAKEKIKDIEYAPPLWKTASTMASSLGVTEYSMKKYIAPFIKDNPDWVGEFLDKIDIPRFYYHPDLVKKIEQLIKPIVRAKEQFLPAPKGWKTSSAIDFLIKNLTKNRGRGGGVKRYAISFKKEHPDWFKLFLDKNNSVREHYHPELVRVIINEFERRLTARSNAGIAPKGWLTNGAIAKELGVDREGLKSFTKRYYNERPDWFVYYVDSTSNLTEHYHPELISKIKEHYLEIQNTKIQNEEMRVIDKGLPEYISSLSDPAKAVGKHFQDLIRVFGASRAIDLLYKFRPEFKGLPVERVKSCLAEYLGDFLIIKQDFNMKDLAIAVPLLSEISFREGLFETMKSHCLRYYFFQRKNGIKDDSYEIIYNYLIHIVDQLGDTSNEFLEQVILDVVAYFASAIKDFYKPEKFVDKLSADREFPDINQCINMKELKDKKRMLIADEMGLGKSASVIMTKEQLGVGCALIIAPSGVINDTWRSYLSDNPQKKGYFKTGQAPRTLVVEEFKDLAGVTKADFDYIIISLEKLNGRYAPMLEALDPDMLIIDESHKLKNIKAGKKPAVRSRALMPLARKLQEGDARGENRYLALLSGTPIPNKVRDIAFTLKLLYPEQFADMPSAELVHNIIHGEIINLRSLLVPRMQMKELEDVVEMPNRTQEINEISMTKPEAEVYEMLLELDELTAQEKMRALRQFLLNPGLLDSTPGIEGAKIAALREELQKAFATKSKVVVFVNDYISGVIRGNLDIISHLNLQPDIEVRYIYGGDEEENKIQRVEVQREFNNSNKRILLFVSGGSGGVGISLIGAEKTIVYNETWTEDDMRQQKSRVFRPGLTHDISETTLIVKGTIEQGIHEYALRKHAVVQKILKGIPISDLEQRMVVKSEGEDDQSIIAENIDLEINPELARTYFSWKQRLTQMFGHTKELGEESMLKFLETWGEDYAEGYRQVGARSYQANTNRVTGTLIDEMVKKTGRHPAAHLILDVASGPEMLRRHIGNTHQASVYSLDINRHHFKDLTSGKTHVGSWTKMPFKPHSFDYLNCAMAFQDSSFAPSRGRYERVDVLREMNRVLKIGGRTIVSMIYSMKMRDMEKFKLFAEAAGFHVVQDYTGQAEFENQFHSQIITLEKFADIEKTAEQIVTEVGVENVVGLKMHKTNKVIKNDREILTGFLFDGKAKIVDLNDSDRTVLREEKEIAQKVSDLKRQHNSIKQIPAEEIIALNFVRIRAGKDYYLFKRLHTASGVVILK